MVPCSYSMGSAYNPRSAEPPINADERPAQPPPRPLPTIVLFVYFVVHIMCTTELPM